MNAAIKNLREIHIIEDSEEDFIMCQRTLLKSNFAVENIHWYKTFSDFKNNLHKSSNDFVFLDLGLPDIEGEEAIHQISIDPLNIPFVVLTGNKDLEQGAKSLALGALDFLSKNDISSTLILRSILLSLERRRLTNDLKAEKENAVKQAKLVTLGETAANIAHEINNPMMVIMGYTDRVISMLKKKPTDQEKEIYFLEKVQRTCFHVADIVKSLKGYSQAESSSKILKVSVRELFSDLEMLANLKCKHYGIILKFDKTFSPDLSFECRKAEILQVLCNLVNNSCDAIKELKEKWILVNVRAKESNLIFQVIDSGKGIPQEIQGKILTPYFTTKEDSTGLGLSISQKIIKAHKGSLNIQKKSPNTCFEIVIPIKQDQVKIKLVADRNGPKEISLTKRILIIEDEKEIQEFYNTSLTKAGHKVTLASTCHQGLNHLVIDEKFDLIITDIDMPYKSGLQVIESLFRLVKNPLEINIIICSAHISNQIRKLYSKYQNISFLEKPIYAKQLLSRVQES